MNFQQDNSDELFWPTFPASFDPLYAAVYKDYKKLINCIANKLRRSEVLAIVYQNDMPMWFSEVGPMKEPGYALRVLSQLEGKNEFSPTNLTPLAQLMEDIGRIDLKESVCNFENKHKTEGLTNLVQVASSQPPSTMSDGFQRFRGMRRSFDNPRKITRSRSDGTSTSAIPPASSSYCDNAETYSYSCYYPSYPSSYTYNHYIHPQTQSPYPQTHFSYPQTQSPYPQTQSPYPQTQSPYPQTQSPYPQTHFSYLQTQSQYPQTQSQYPQTQSPYPQTQSQTQFPMQDVETDSSHNFQLPSSAGQPEVSGDLLSIINIAMLGDTMAKQIQNLMKYLPNTSPELYQSLMDAYFLTLKANSCLSLATKTAKHNNSSYEENKQKNNHFYRSSNLYQGEAEIYEMRDDEYTNAYSTAGLNVRQSYIPTRQLYLPDSSGENSPVSSKKIERITYEGSMRDDQELSGHTLQPNDPVKLEVRMTNVPSRRPSKILTIIPSTHTTK